MSQTSVQAEIVHNSRCVSFAPNQLCCLSIRYSQHIKNYQEATTSTQQKIIIILVARTVLIKLQTAPKSKKESLLYSSSSCFLLLLHATNKTSKHQHQQQMMATMAAGNNNNNNGRHRRSISFSQVDSEQASGILGQVFKENDVFLGGCSIGKGLKKAAGYYLNERAVQRQKMDTFHLSLPGAQDLAVQGDAQTPVEEAFYVVDLGVVVSQVYQCKEDGGAHFGRF